MSFLPTEVLITDMIFSSVLKTYKISKAMWSSQHGFTKGKLCLTNLVTVRDG